MSNRPTIARREMLRMAALSLGATALAACTPQAPAQPTAAPAKPAAPAPAATQPPAATAPAAPTQAPAAGAAPAPTAQSASAQAVASKPAAPAERRAGRGRAWIAPDRQAGGADGRPGRRPDAEDVQGGADAGRAGQGRQAPARRAARAGRSRWSSSRSTRSASTAAPGGAASPGPAMGERQPDRLGRQAPVLATTPARVVPSVAKAWKLSDDGQTITHHPAQGHKWSDGQPFTADDFVFWYEDIYSTRSWSRSRTPSCRSTASRARSRRSTTTPSATRSRTRTSCSSTSWPARRIVGQGHATAATSAAWAATRRPTT